jgi:pyruvate dehydrogenase kinase 2/3/4
VRDMYVESFKELREFPAIKDMPDEIKFCGLLNDIYERHKNVVPLLALGVSELKRDFSTINEVSAGAGGGGRLYGMVCTIYT